MTAKTRHGSLDQSTSCRTSRAALVATSRVEVSYSFCVEAVEAHALKSFFFFFQAEDGIRDYKVTGVQTCALPIYHVQQLRQPVQTQPAQPGAHPRRLTIGAPAAEAVKREWDQVHPPA